MKEFYKNRIASIDSNIKDRELLASDEELNGSNDRATEYKKQIKSLKQERENYSKALGQMK